MEIQDQEFLLQFHQPVHQGSLPRRRGAKHNMVIDLLHILSACTLPLDLVDRWYVTSPMHFTSAVNASPGASIRHIFPSSLIELDAHDNQWLELLAQDHPRRSHEHDAANTSSPMHQLSNQE